MKRTSFIKHHFRLFPGSLLLVALLLLALSGVLPRGLTHLFQSTAHAASNPIQVENSNPGTPGWDAFDSISQQDAISGYGSKISVNHGDSIDFYVTTTAASFTIDIFRTGYYQGIGARLITYLGRFPGVHQPIPL